MSGSGTFLNGNPVFAGPGRTAGSGRIQNEGNAPRKGLGNEVGGGVCRLFENSTVCLLVNAKFFVPVAWLIVFARRVGWLVVSGIPLVDFGR